MSSILQQLKIKDPPKTRKQFEVRIKETKEERRRRREERRRRQREAEEEKGDSEREPVKPRKKPVKIVDRTEDSDFDRNAFLNTLKQRGLTVPRIPEEEMTETLLEKFEPEEEKETEIVDIEKDTVSKPKKMKKKKFKLVSEKESKVESKEDEPLHIVKKPKKKLKLVDKSEKKTEERTRKSKRPDLNIIAEYPSSMMQIGDVDIEERIKKDEIPIIRASSYYLNNREKFINFINALFLQYKDEIQESSKEVSCEKRRESTEFSLLTHQKIVRDYLNIYSPYRGLLLYHGLGSGKTCSSIAIAEGLKTKHQVIVMTPAALRSNYVSELKKCGDALYKKTQFWEFIPLGSDKNKQLLATLSGVLDLPMSYIRKQGGAWLVNMTKEPNFNTLTNIQRSSLNKQLNEMIRTKYKFINYNGMRMSHLEELTQEGTINPFDNKVVVIDEAHNFISRIVGKLRNPSALSMQLYHYLLSAENCRVVLLSGTPIINYPNELGIMFNIIRGYIKSWSIPLNIKTGRKIDIHVLREMFSRYAILDYIDYRPSSNTLVVTRNPYGFMTTKKKGIYQGVKYDEKAYVSDQQFERFIFSQLKKNDIEIFSRQVKVQRNKALPDNFEEFRSLFIKENGEVTNTNMFKRRILGLASYFRSAQEKLMPKYESRDNFRVIKSEMSDYQFGIYEQARSTERELERETAKRKMRRQNVADNEIYQETSSTYRIFSRSFCNFVFPTEIKRPMPKKELKEAVENVDETVIESITPEEALRNPDGKYSPDDEEKIKKKLENQRDPLYESKISSALNTLYENKDELFNKENLAEYSPKFLQVLEMIQDKMSDSETDGLHLIYSQFRTMEGIGIFSIVLEAHGFTRFKIKKGDLDDWVLDIREEDKGKPMYALHTGTETEEEKEIIKNVFNSNWGSLPSTLLNDIQTIHSNNLYGNVIKILMITASGAEGINLRNVRYVHLMESYWHPVRIDQVIGRARRICSHEDLPERHRTIDVYLYLMTFTEEQKTSDKSIELRLKDLSRIDNKTPLTSDEALYEISTIKQEINNQLLRLIKEASIDCVIHTQDENKENLSCFSFGVSEPDKFSYQPSYKGEETDKQADLNRKTITWKAVTLTIGGKRYKLRLNEDGKPGDKVYDYDSFMRAKTDPSVVPIYIGKLVVRDKVAKIIHDQ